MADNRSLIAIAAGASVVAAMAVATPGGRSAGARGSPQRRDTVVFVQGERAKRAEPFDEGRTLLWREIGGGGSDSTGDSRDEKIRRAFLDSTNRQLTILIATVADPVDSHLDWLYDLQLAAIRLAHATAGYVPSGYWLEPWSKGAQSSDARNTRPGVMLFRSIGGHQLSLVYLVGELPTTGIHKSAFRTAVTERRAILNVTCRRPGKEHHELLVIGPTFAGGALSLRQTLDEIDTIPARVVTGTVTADTAAVILGRSPAKGIAPITYTATVHTDRTFWRVRDALIRRAWADSELGILSEASTTYGVVSPSNHAPLHVPFPLNIATLRTAYARDRNDSASAANVGDRRLPLQWRDPPRAEEVPAPMSALTMPSIDQAFEDVARLFRGHHLKILELNATDIRDKLFLADQIRQRVPDVQLLTRDMHVLYVDPAIAPTVRGLLILSTYPPNLRNQSRLMLDPADSNRRLPFLSDGMEGVYNATLLQLGDRDRLADYRWPFDSDTAAGSRLPPVWISVVGSGGIVAVRAERATDADTAGMFAGRTPPPVGDHWPIRSQAFFLAAPFALAALALLWSLGKSIYDGVGNYDRSRLTLSLGIITALAPAAATALRSRVEVGAPDWMPHGLLWVGFVASIVAYGLALVLHIQVVAGVLPPQWPRRVILFVAHAVAVLALVAAAVLLFTPGVGDPNGGDVLIDRITLVTRGVSPIVPAVLIGLGVMVWGWWDSERLWYLSNDLDRAPLFVWLASVTPTTADASTNLLDAARYAKQVKDRMTKTLLGGWTKAFAGTLLIVVLIAIWHVQMPLEDVAGLWRPGFGATALRILLQAGIGASVAAPLWMTVYAWLVWQDLQGSLNALSRTPLYSAFGRLPTFASRISQLAVVSVGWLARLRALSDVGGLQEQELLTQIAARPIAFGAVWTQLTADWAAEPDALVLATARKSLQGLPARDADGTFALQPSALSTYRRTFPTGDRLWMRGAEEWLALQVVVYAEWVFQYLARITQFVLLMVVITTLVLSSYPFYPQDFFVRTFFAIAAVCAIALIWLMASINRDETVSAITNTTPGKLSWNTSFVSNLLVIGGIPLLTLLSASFPAIRGVLFAWVQPLLSAVSKGNL